MFLFLKQELMQLAKFSGLERQLKFEQRSILCKNLQMKALESKQAPLARQFVAQAQLLKRLANMLELLNTSFLSPVISPLNEVLKQPREQRVAGFHIGLVHA